ncbi:hypothetical protein JCM19046_3499 [Bacillus sp. JCM 19046]|nr:hypothetical protein JCM19046_3499 [Bacillus sp. JCM 19046]
MSENELYYMTSPHLESIEINQRKLAYYKAKSLLNLLNSAYCLYNRYPITTNDQLILDNQYEKKGFSEGIVQEKFDEIDEYEALFTPFNLVDSKLIEEKEDTSYLLAEVIDLAYTDEIVREVLILFGLSRRNKLYLLINLYKIIELIEYDNIKHFNTDNLKDAVKLMPEVLTEAYGNVKKFSGYMNTHSESKYLSRHGPPKSSGRDYKGPRPTIDEVMINTSNLIITWIHLKIYYKTGRQFKIIHWEP